MKYLLMFMVLGSCSITSLWANGNEGVENGFSVQNWKGTNRKEWEGKTISGLKEGMWIFYYPDGKTIREKGNFHAGMKMGKWTEYYQDGHPYKLENYENDLLSGLFASLDGKGNKMQKGQYEDGKQTGVWKSWYGNGQLESEGSFDKGNETGLWTEWYDNGQKKMEGVFQKSPNFYISAMIRPWHFWLTKGEPFSIDDLIPQELNLIGINLDNRQNCLFLTLSTDEKSGEKGRFEFIQRPGDAKPLLYFRHGRSILPILDHKGDLILINNGPCSDCRNLLMHVLKGGKEWPMDLETNRDYNQMAHAKGCETSSDGQAFSPDDNRVLIHIGCIHKWGPSPQYQDWSYVVDTFTGHILHTYKTVKIPENWWEFIN